MLYLKNLATTFVFFEVPMKIIKTAALFFLVFIFTYFWGGDSLINHQLLFSSNEGRTVTPITQQKVDRSPFAYITSQNSKEITVIDLGTGLEGNPIVLDFPMKILAISRDGKTAYIVTQDLCHIQGLNLLTKEITNVADLDKNLNKFVVSQDGESAYLSYEKSYVIDHLNLFNQEFTQVGSFKHLPNCMVLDPSQDLLYVSFHGSNEILSIDLQSSTTEPFLFLDSTVDALTLSQDGKKMYAFQEASNQLTIIDKQTKAIKTDVAIAHPMDGPKKKIETIGLNASGTRAYLVQKDPSEIIPLNLKTNKVEPAILVDHAIEAIEFDAQQELVASFTVNQASPGKPTVFKASATTTQKQDDLYYAWNFGDGLEAVSESPSVEHIYDSPGEFTTTLTVNQPVEPLSPLTHLSSTAEKTFKILFNDFDDAFDDDSDTFDDLSELKQTTAGLGTETSTTQGTPSASNIIFGNSVTDSVVVTGSFTGGSPTGTVTFLVNGNPLGGAATLTPGPSNTATATSASYTPPSVGSYQFTATYGGDGTYAGSSDASPTNAFTVGPVSSTTNLTTSINPTVFGQSMTLTANVVLGGPTATGTITFMDGATMLGAPVTLVGGSASLLYSSLSVGSHNLTAVYNSNNPNYAGSTSNLLTQTVNQAGSTTVLTSSVNPVLFGNSTTLTATISAASPGAGSPTGTVAFRDGAVTIGTGTISGGVVTFPISTLAVGSRNLTAVYVGDTNFTTSTSNIVVQVVSQGTTTSSVVSSVNPTTYGSPTTFTATVALATGAGTPTGSFTFKDGATVLGTANLTGASASFTVSNLAVGSHAITAVYSGDINFSTSTATLSPVQVVARATAGVTVNSSLNPSNYGQMVTFTSTVSAPTTLGLPSGTVSFFDGATLIGTGTLIPIGANTSTTTFATQNLSGGTHAITAVYGGDTNFVAPATAPSLTQTVILANTTTVIYSSSSNPSEFGQPVILNAKVTGSVASPPLSPGGTVTFYDGATPIGIATVTMISANQGIATLTTSSLAIGLHTLTAIYSGDINYNPSTTTTPMMQRVIKTTTTLVTTTSGTPSVVGQTVTFTATVSSNAPGTGSPTGTVQFYDGITLLGSGTLVLTGPNTSQATYSTSSLTLGNHSITSFYSGDTNYTSSNAPAITQVVVQDSTSVATVVSNLNPSQFGDNVTFSATVTANPPGSGTPTGIVTFKDGATIIGTGTLNGSGVASFVTKNLYPGTHPITASYAGDANYIASASVTPLNQVVQNQLTTAATVTSSRNSSPFSQAVTYSATVVATPPTMIPPFVGIPAGNVNFFDGAVLIGTGTLNAQGVATFTQPGTSLTTYPTTHNITAVYIGDANFLTSTSPIYPQYIVEFDTTNVLTVSANPSQQGTTTLSATINATGPTAVPPFAGPGTVTFYQNGVPITGGINLPVIGPGPVTVSFLATNLTFNMTPIVAIYTGDTTTFARAVSNTVTLQVQQTDMLTTATTLTTSLTPSFFCQAITLTASVANTQGFYLPTDGTVTFFDGTTAIGTALLNLNSQATLVVADLSIGTHTLTATYNSDSNYAFSTSTPITQVVNPDPTLTTLTIIPNQASTPYGASLTFVVKVTATSGIPTGSVILADEDGTIATLDLDSTGTGFYTTTTLPVGVHTFTATYDPACCSVLVACFGVSSANSLVHTITAVNPNTTLTATPSPATYGDTITLQGTVVSYGAGTPTGSVTFSYGATVIGTSQIINGVATIDVSDLPAGVVIFRATYNPDTASDFSSSNFPSTLVVINKATPVISDASFTNPSQFGQSVTFSATVSSLISIPTGTITFSSGSLMLGTAALNASGVASLNAAILPVGSNVIRAVYSGDSNFLTVMDTSVTQVVTKATSQTTITSTAVNPSPFNTAVNVNVAVTALSPANGIPTGTVTGFYGSVTLGTATLNNGVASFVTSPTALPVGTPTITVVYGGDTNFTGSQGSATHTVTSAVTTIPFVTFTSSANPSVYGQSVTFSAKVSSPAGTPAGTAAFFDGAIALGTETLDASGNVSFTTSSLAIGPHPIRVIYAGNSTFNSATSAILNQVVNRASTTVGLTTSVNPSVYGEAVTFTAAVSPVSPGVGTPKGTITFRANGVILGTSSLNNGSVAIFTTASLAANATPYLITAIYSGDTNFAPPATAPTLNQRVIPVSTITSAVSSPNPSTIGQSVSIIVTVAPINIGLVTPGGTVTASYGATVIGTGSLNSNGTITFLTSTLPAGTIPIIITYAGNPNFLASSTTLVQTVAQASTTTTLISSLNPSRVGQSVTFTATVTSPFGAPAILPTGTVTFFDGSTAIGAQVLNGGGVATLTTSSLTLGNHNIVALYNGDDDFSTSTSTMLVQNVTSATTSILLTSSVNPSVLGQSTILTANITVTAGSGSPTGTVTFKDGVTVIGIDAVSGGVATLNVSNLTVGSHNLTAVYSGDSNFGTSTSPAITQTVNAAPTATALTSSVNPSTFGQTTVLTATTSVTLGSGTPTGTVTFKDGATVLGTGNLNNGQATLSVSTLSVGSHSLTVVYGATANFATSTSPVVTQVVGIMTSSVAVTSSVNPSVFGQTIVLTATVPQGSAPTAPTGTVNFFADSNPVPIGTATLAGGVATLSYSNFSIGSHSIKAIYSGDGNFSTATSPVIAQLVGQAPTTTTLASSLNPSTFGDAVTFTATITSATGPIPASGLVVFSDGAALLGTISVSAGVATLTTSTLTPRTHTITATFINNPSFATSTSSPLLQVVNQGTTSVSVSSSGTPSTFGSNVTFTANVTALTGIGTPTGSVSFYDGLTLIGFSTLSGGVATSTVSTLSVGSHLVTAVYSGGPNFIGATSPNWTQVVIKANSATNILSNAPNPSMAGENVTFFAVVTVPTGAPSGTVTFFDGATPLGSVSVFDGIASFSTQLLTLGTHTITAMYNGDANFNASISPPVAQTVNPSSITVTTTTTVTGAPNPSNFGQNVIFSIDVAPIAGPGIPAGQVTIYSGAVFLGQATLDGNGETTFQTSALPAGNSNIVALYNGNSSYSASIGTTVQTVIAISSATTLTSSLNPSQFGDAVTFTATVTSTSGTPTGTVTFYDGAIPIGTGLLVNGVAVFNTSLLQVGSHAMTASYGGNTNFAPSTSAPLTQVVNTNISATTTVLTSSANPALVETPVTFNAQVTSTTGTPTGTVTFFDGTMSIGTSILTNGMASLTTSTLGVGNRNITAVYNGNGIFGPSTSNVVLQVILASPAPAAPTNFYGCQEHRKYINDKGIVNVLRWTPPQSNLDIHCFKVYRNPQLTDLVGTVYNQCPFSLDDSRRKKNKTYTYYLVSVNHRGIKSAAVSTTVRPRKEHMKHCDFLNIHEEASQRLNKIGNL